VADIDIVCGRYGVVIQNTASPVSSAMANYQRISVNRALQPHWLRVRLVHRLQVMNDIRAARQAHYVSYLQP